MNFIHWIFIGTIILILDVAWIVVYYYYATVKIYNYHGKETYQYLGYQWIRKKNGEYYVTIPEEMIEKSITTQYKIESVSGFHKLKKGKKLYIDFAGDYGTEVMVKATINVKNYIATSHRL